MTKTLYIFAILLISLNAKAQSDDDIAYFQSIWGMEKRAIVSEYMGIAPQSEFWQEYDAYELSRKELTNDRIEILKEYANNYASLSDDKAKELINRSADNKIAIQKLLKKSFKKMSKTITSVEAAKFVQLENYFLTSIQMAIMESIPFVGELDDLIEE